MRGLAYWLFFLFLLHGGSVVAQHSTLPQLEKQFNQATADTTKLQLAGQLTDAYTSVDIDKKLHYARFCQTLAGKLHNDTALANAYLNIGVVMAIKSKNDSAQNYFSKAYNQAAQVKFYRVMGKSLSDIGFTYDRLDDKQDAIKTYFEALPLLRKAHFLRGINQCLTNIGSIYFDLLQYKMAKSYFEECLKSSELNHDTVGIAYALFNVGSCYQKLGENDKAMDDLSRSLAMRQMLGDQNGIALVQRSIGNVYLNQKNYQLSLNYLDTALKTVTRLQDKYEQTAFILDKADVYIASGDYAQAKICALQAIKNGHFIHSKMAVSEGYDKLIAMARKQHDIVNGYHYQEQYIAVSDSMQADKAINDVTVTELNRMRSENATLAKDNDSISSQNNDYMHQVNRYGMTILVIAVVLLTVIILSVILYRNNIEKRAVNLQLQQQKLEIATVNRQLANQNDELARLNNIKNKFFSIVSHDLRSPIVTLQTLFRVYREGDMTPAELQSLLVTMEDSLMNTGTFLDNLLEWSRSQLDGMKVNPVNFDLNELIDENIHLFETKIGLKELNVSNLSHQPVMVFADRNMINVVVRNLLSNSIKFCNLCDQITFNVEPNGKIVTMTIADTGPGIGEQEAAKLFSLEYQVSEGTQGEKGSGLGLVLVKDMLMQNQGDISLNTQADSGTTFRITLPAGKA